LNFGYPPAGDPRPWANWIEMKIDIGHNRQD